MQTQCQEQEKKIIFSKLREQKQLRSESSLPPLHMPGTLLTFPTVPAKRKAVVRGVGSIEYGSKSFWRSGVREREATMAKKKKVRVDLRKNRTKPPRPNDWTRGFQEHGFTEEGTLQDER